MFMIKYEYNNIIYVIKDRMNCILTLLVSKYLGKHRHLRRTLSRKKMGIYEYW